MPTIVQRYPATTIAAVVLLIVGAIAAAILLSADDAGNQRFGLLLGIIGPAVVTLLAVQKTEQGNRETEAVKKTIETAVADGQSQSPVVFEALRQLVESTRRVEAAATKAETAATTIEATANGHATGELHTRSTDQ